MKLTTEELTRANSNGTLESLLLGYGIMPLDALKFVLDDVNSLHEYIGELEEVDLEEEYDEDWDIDED